MNISSATTITFNYIISSDDKNTLLTFLFSIYILISFYSIHPKEQLVDIISVEDSIQVIIKYKSADANIWSPSGKKYFRPSKNDVIQDNVSKLCNGANAAGRLFMTLPY